MTEARRVSRAAVTAERRAALASRIAGFVTWEIDAETLAIVYDTGLAALFGLAPGETADSVADFAAHIHPDDQETVLTALELGGGHHLPLRHRRHPRRARSRPRGRRQRDVKIGGVSTVRQYLQAGLIDELHVAVSPVLLGRGEALFEDLDLPALGYRVIQTAPTELATHVVIGR